MEIKNILKKPYTENQRLNFIVLNNYELNYEIKETPKALEAWGKDDNDLLIDAKENKIIENDRLRDEALNRGVMYKDILFDSDTDQKVNLLATVSMMNKTDTITWFGMNNQPLECNKEDLINIGNLIIQLHSYCWNKNALLKSEINNAETIEKVNSIEISYLERGENV